MNCAVHADGERRPGYVGPPLPGVDLRLVDDDGRDIPARDDETIGEVALRGPNLFLGDRNRPEATADVVTEGWFHTGDLATIASDGYVRIVGRRATDLIKTGGFKVGAGEVEAALLEHPAVAEAAVTGEPDDRLGERIVAWLVLKPGTEAGAKEFEDYVAGLLAAHCLGAGAPGIRSRPSATPGPGLARGGGRRPGPGQRGHRHRVGPHQGRRHALDPDRSPSQDGPPRWLLERPVDQRADPA